MFTGFEESKKVETIKFGSEITFRANSTRPYFLYCDGFNSTGLCAMALGQTTWEKTINFDFEKAVFKILPFSGPGNFKYLNTVYSYLKGFAQERDRLGKKALDERKDEVSDLRQKFFDELATNIDSYEKMKNTPVSFNSGVFVLVHKASMKYLSLLDDEQDELVYHLVDYPNEGSFFTAAPCLKMQTQRTNYLYSGDLVTLINQQIHVNSNPKAWIGGDTSALEEEGPELVSLPAYANLEKHTPLKVSLYMDIETAEDQSVLKTGDVVWLNFSERPYYLEAQLPNSSLEGTLHWITNQLYARTTDQKAETTAGPSAGAEGGQAQHPDALIGTLMEKLFSKFRIGYRRIHEDNGTVGSSSGKEGSYITARTPKSEGLFKIETQSMVIGERVCWLTNYYRFKHVLSGRYLAIDPDSPDSNYLTLERLPTTNSLVSFMPIQSGSTVETASRYVFKDSYYQLRSLTKNWLRLPLRKLEAKQNQDRARSAQANSGRPSNDSSFNSGTPHSSSKPRSARSDLEAPKELDYGLANSTDIDTLRVNLAEVDHVKQMNFLMASYPIILNSLIVIGDLNSQLRSSWNQQKAFGQNLTNSASIFYKHFESMFPKLDTCLSGLIDYLLNQSPSNINMSEEFGSISATRQQTLLDLKIAKMVVILVDNLFPFLDELTNERRSRLQAFAFNLAANGDAGSDAVEAKDKMERLEELNFFKRIKLISKCLELIRLICYANQQAQLHLAASLPVLTRYVGFSPSASHTIREILKNNDSLLMEYSKIKKVSLFDPNQGSPRTLHPKSPASPQNQDSNVQSGAKGSFGQRAAQVGLNNALVSMAKGQQTGSQHLRKSGHHRHSAVEGNRGGFESPHSGIGSADDLMKSLEDNISRVGHEPGTQIKENFDFKFFKTIAQRMGLYPAYSQADVLSYFRYLSHTQHRGFFLNQNEIFAVMFRSNLATESLIQTSYAAAENELLVRYVNKEGDIFNERFPDLLRGKHSRKLAQFFKESLLLYSSLSLFRNDITGRYFRNKFPLQLLVKYARDDGLPDEFRAVFLRLMHALYLDREPRSHQPLPSLIHPEDKHIKLSSAERAFLSKEEIDLISKAAEATQTKQLPLSSLPKLSESKQELLIITRLKEVMIESIEARSKSLYTNPPEPGKFFNEFTWEMLKVLHSLIKFDCYDITDENQAEVCRANMALIERIIKCLTFPLEFDADYHSSLLSTTNKLAFRQNRYNSQGAKSKPNPSKLRKGFNNAINLNAYNSSTVLAALDAHSGSAVFRKSLALRKIISLFSNKIYQAPERDFAHKGLNIAESVKIEICKIFDLLSNNREEQLLLNTLEFFRTEFSPQYPVYYRQIKAGQEAFVFRFMPDHCFEAGQDKPETTRPQQVWTYNKLPVFRSFDQITGRSFPEVLWVSFYFATTPELQGLLCKLLENTSSQQKRFLSHIQSTLLLKNAEELDVYKKLRLNLQELEAFKSVSQVWYMIIKKSLYEREYERALVAASTRLQELYQYLKVTKESNGQMFYLQQQLLRKLNTHVILLDFIKEGYVVFETMEEIAKDFTTAEDHFRIDVFDILCNFFRHCHLVIILFCDNNAENQLLIAEQVKLFLSNRYINFGPVAPTNDKGKGGSSLKFLTSDQVLDFLMDLIAFHGELPQVLRLFILMIETGGKSSVFVKRAIFQKILSKERLLQFKISGNYAQETHSEPYLGLPDLKLGLPLNLDPIIKNVETQVRYFSFETLRNRDEYELLMMKLLAACIDNRSGINTITKAFDLYSFEDMVGTANDRAKRLRDSNIDPEKEVSYLQYLEAGVNILYLYMTSFEKYFLKFIERSPPTIKGMFDHILQVLDGMTMESERALKSPSAFFFSLLRIAQKSMSAYLKTSEPGYLMDQTAGFFSQFCNKVISELETRISKEVTEEEILLLKQVVRTMQLSLPQILEGAIQDYNERKGIINQQQRNDILNTSMVDVISSAITLKGSRSSDKGILKENTLGRKTIGNKYKEILMASEKEELNSSKQQLMNQDKLTETSDTSYIHGGDLADLPNDEKWGFFQRFLSNSSLVKAELVTEQKTLTNTLINFVMAYSDDDPNEMMIFCEDLVSKVVELLEFWQQRRIGKHSALFLVRILSNILRATSTPLEKSRIQIMMNSYGLMRILISIFVQEQDNDIMFLSEMIKLGGFLLEGGNRTIQDAIFKFFTRDPLTSEQFFSKVSGFLRKHALFLQTLKGDSEEPSLDNHYFPIQILELIRLFCENHHTEMQNYIRHQEGAKNQHDIVECTIQLLISCKVSPFTRPTIEKIFETLTEFAQGPCRENQIRIATSGFLEYAASLLKRDPKHRMHHSGTQPPAEGQPSPQRRLARQQTLGLSNFKRNVSAGAKTLNEKASGKDSKTKGAMGGDYFIQGIVEKLRYKCLTTTMALLEKLEPESIVVERIRKTIPVWVIKENLIQIYQKYQIRFGSKYVDSAFRKYDSPDADASCVIENGFFVYLLASVMIESIKPEEEERYSKIMAFKLELEACDRGENTMKRLFGKLGSSLKDTFDKTASALRLGEDSKAPADEKKLTQQALKFFKSKIIHIEIVRDAKLERVSFPKLPACFNLPKRTRALFTEEVDRKSITTKLINLSEAVPFFLRVMEHETRLSEVADAFGVLGYLLYHQINWLIWVMYFLGVVINGILLFVYNSAEDDGENVTGRIVYIIFVLGMIDLGLSLYITVMMSIRNIPVMLKELITEAAAAPPTVVDPNTSLSTFNRVWTKVYSVLRAIMNVLYRLSQDETSYYLLFVLSNFTGLFYDLLAYIFQLSFVVKLDLLKNVVSALWIRKTQLTLTFLLLILIFYYYAIIGYQFFPEDFPLKRCDQLFDCLIVTFDLTFKDGGGIGVFLTNIWTVYSNDSRAKFYTRFFYDLSLAMILVNVMLNIVTGIIIDEFGSLKDSMNERLEDTFNTCFACGFARDVFERNNVDFEKHVRQDHYQWNYVYFIAYLMRKKKTDLTGTESYVMDLYRDHDFTWFPIKKARGIKDDEEEQTQRYNQVSALESAMKGLKDEFDFVLDKTNRMYEDLLLEKQ